VIVYVPDAATAQADGVPHAADGGRDSEIGAGVVGIGAGRVHAAGCRAGDTRLPRRRFPDFQPPEAVPQRCATRSGTCASVVV
jgi:hypothetical protein